MPENQIEMVPVFYAKRRVTDLSKPEFWMDRQVARDMVDSGLAKWTRHAKGIMLNRKGAEMTKTAQSLRMGAAVIHANATGCARSQAIVAGWIPAMVPSREPVKQAA